ncbi:Na+/H+ antiporter subunit E [Tabrizicola sp.]|uniref:Na+/H+ antiporter subunit E n=1 Tax=Tabrizicola sp. TaxID=2005166 RepID=UPI000BD88DED|nr:Na+/H+ antiporter subunit E [Tabrizicola sp.]MBY0351932.1 Na+/H+ antiporter subunit E [Tabrizicola sp.]MDK2774332.1 Na+/H+ antiporter subunit E [Tabrizicola sp.]OYX18811.1 MAG: Na+/H+ antiporter subunit E [Rhodobacterales bacterium 32-66-9]
MKRLFPHPYLSLTLIALWFLLVNQLKIGSLVMAIILGTVIPLVTAAWWPNRPRVRHPFRLAAYVILVLWDVIVANFQVARIVLFMPRDRIRSNWVTIPLDLTSPEAISLLAGTITMTPGTVTSDISACGRALLVHSLHAPDPGAVRDEIKSRYEARLKRIFE